jgi:hypothetical protein
MRACKNAVSAQRPNVPLAYIQVDSPRSNGGSQLSNFRIQPPNGPWSAGSCDVFRNGRVNVTFTGGGNNNGGNSDGYGNGGYGGGASTPQTVQQLCKDAASAHLPGVPLAYIDTYRGSDTGDGSYMINFRAQPRGRPNSSGFCIISKRGQLERFEFDPGAGPGNGGNYGGGNNSGGGDRTTPRCSARTASARSSPIHPGRSAPRQRRQPALHLPRAAAGTTLRQRLLRCLQKREG